VHRHEAPVRNRHHGRHCGHRFLVTRHAAVDSGGHRHWPDDTAGYQFRAPSPHSGPASPGPGADQGAIILTHADVSAVFAAADIAADDKRYRVEMCPDCPDQSCPACQTHLRDAEAFDRIADRMLQAARTAPAARPGHTGPPRQSGTAADKEAGQ
jgi:hypothetical protein